MDARTAYLVKLYAYGLLPIQAQPRALTQPDKKRTGLVGPKRKKQGKIKITR